MKKIIVLMLLLLPFGLMAQEIKVAVVNAGEVFNLMPETSALESEMATMRQQYEREAKAMEDEYTRKYSDLALQSDSLTDNIRRIRIQEIEDIQTRLQNFVPMAQEAMEKRQRELYLPIEEKIQKVIKEVGDENGYTFIINPQYFLYQGNGVIDATEKVKAKLGLR